MQITAFIDKKERIKKKKGLFTNKEKGLLLDLFLLVE